MPRRSQYSREWRQRAVRMVAEIRPNYGSEYAAIKVVAGWLGVGSADTVRRWVRQAEIDAGRWAGPPGEELAELGRLRAEVRELRRANEILQAAAGLVVAELGRPPQQS